MKSLADCQLYGILDLGYLPATQAAGMTAAMIEGGIDLLQVRAKESDEHEIQSLAATLLALTEPAGIPLIVNDHPELVPAVGAQGAHVGQDDLPVEEARWRAGRVVGGEGARPMIGKSTHSVEQAVAAQEEGADYIGFGPLHATPTKPGRPAIGLGDIRRVHELVSIPIFCIGGIKLENLDLVLAAGARRVVIVSGILQGPDPRAYARAAKTRLQKS